MIRDFSRCGSNQERINFLKSAASKDYSQDELKTLCNVMSFIPEPDINKNELLSTMIAELEQRLQEEGMGIHKISKRLNEMEQY